MPGGGSVGRRRSHKRLGFSGAALALLAAGVSGYLAWASLVLGGLPPGCGAGSGCAAVLSSKWSSLAGVPVAAPAVVVHLAMAGLLVATVTASPGKSRAAARWLALPAGLAIAAAAWFALLQWVVLEAVCPWCMADHALAVAAGVIALVVAARSSAGAARLSVGGGAAVLLVALLAGAQALSTPAIVTFGDMPVDRDFDRAAGDRRFVGLLGGELRLAVGEEPGFGPVDAAVVALMYDYACPHCRHTHAVLKRRLAERPDACRVLLLPTPVDPGCNPHAPADPDPRFDESCEVARLALAVWRADAAKFPDFDAWLFDPETPRAADAARGEAERLVGRDALDAALADPWIDDVLARNTEAYGESGAGRVPVLIRPGVAPVIGRIEDPRHLAEVLAMPSGLSESEPAQTP